MGKRAGWMAGVLAAAMGLSGCVSQTQIAQLTAVLGNDAAQIATLEGNPALGTKLKTDTAAAVLQVLAWKKGTSAEMAVEALTLVEDDLALFPQTSQYAPLIVLSLGTVQSILALLPQSPAVALSHARASVRLSAPAPKTADEFRQQWNAICAANPGLANLRDAK